MVIIEEFLPKQISADDVKDTVAKLLSDAGLEGMKDMGKAMKVVMAELNGKADGNTVQKFVREILSGGN